MGQKSKTPIPVLAVEHFWYIGAAVYGAWWSLPFLLQWIQNPASFWESPKPEDCYVIYWSFITYYCICTVIDGAKKVWLYVAHHTVALTVLYFLDLNDFDGRVVFHLGMAMEISSVFLNIRAALKEFGVPMEHPAFRVVSTVFGLSFFVFRWGYCIPATLFVLWRNQVR
eukprot:Colp12_sorted_trinity150504_noHs@35710